MGWGRGGRRSEVSEGEGERMMGRKLMKEGKEEEKGEEKKDC